MAVNETPCPHCGPGEPDPGFGYGHRSDCPTFTEPYAIAREMAARGTSMSHIGGGWLSCHLCNQAGSPDRMRGDMTGHADTCLWRRAVAWVMLVSSE